MTPTMMLPLGPVRQREFDGHSTRTADAAGMASTSVGPVPVALCIEETLGHRAHGLNLRSALANDARVSLRYVPVNFRPGRVPWALRGSGQAMRSVRAERRDGEVGFFHTQSVALLAPLALPKFVVSVDATPVQLDAMGAHYQHRMHPSAVEQAKRRWYRAVFARAAAVVSWSEWAAQSLRADYGVAPEKVHVLHPGAPRAFFDLPPRASNGHRPRVLFVGGDFERKGGHLLLEAFERLRPEADLTLVTDAAVRAPDGVHLVQGARPGSAALMDAYSEADIFCLPTLGDCTPVVLGEAMAAGLPVVTANVGSNRETVLDGETGLLVSPGNVRALAGSLERLIRQPEDRVRMGIAARAVARDRMNAEDNARRIGDLLCDLA